MNQQHEGSGASTGGVAVRGAPKARIERNLAMTPEADEFLADLAGRTGLSEGDVIRIALGMFKMAIDARQQGKHFGVAGDAEALDVELVGF